MSETPLIRIVDDDPELLASQKMLLETLGWEVITYASGVEFLKHDELKRPGCVVLDMRMPGMTELEVQEELENRGVTHLSIIFLTAHGEVDAAVHAMRHGGLYPEAGGAPQNAGTCRGGGDGLCRTRRPGA